MLMYLLLPSIERNTELQVLQVFALKMNTSVATVNIRVANWAYNSLTLTIPNFPQEEAVELQDRSAVDSIAQADIVKLPTFATTTCL